MPRSSEPDFCRVFVLLSVVGAFSLSLVAKDFVKPTAQPAKTYPAHDDHANDKVAIAADPYNTSDKSKIFSVNFHEHGFLPVFFIVTNDSDQPIYFAEIDWDDDDLVATGQASAG